MIQSMTGYGKATATFGDKKIYVEIKSLNSKAMDLSTRIAPLYREKEMEIRNLISKTLERGKVDVNLFGEFLFQSCPFLLTEVNYMLQGFLNSFSDRIPFFLCQFLNIYTSKDIRHTKQGSKPVFR